MRHTPKACTAITGCSACQRNGEVRGLSIIELFLDRGGNVSDQTAIATAKEEKTKRFHKVKDQEEGTAQVMLLVLGMGEGEGPLISRKQAQGPQEGQWPYSGRRLSWQPGTSSRDCYLHGSYREDSDSGGGGLVAESCLTLLRPHGL